MSSIRQKLKILHLEDLAADAELVARELRKDGIDCLIKWVNNKKDFTLALTKFLPDIILSDHSLPSFDSFGALKIVKELRINVPFILITATTSEEIAVNVMKAGAWDYILKDRMQRLPIAVGQAMDKFNAEREKGLAEIELRATHGKLIFHIENSPLGYIEWHNDFSVKFLSKRVEEIFGWTISDFNEKRINGLDMIYEEDRSWVIAIASKLLHENIREGKNHLIHRSYTKDGSVVWCEWFNSMTKNEAGEVTALMSLVHDISDRKKIEEELKQNQYFLEKASEAAKLGYWTSELDFENGKLAWSNEVYKIFQMEKDEFDGKNSTFFTMVHPDDRDRVKELSLMAKEGNQLYNIDHRVVLKNGMVRWVNERAQFLRNEKNEVTLMVGVVQDINERKIIEQVLREYNDRYEIVSKATNDVIWDWDIRKDKIIYSRSMFAVFGYDELVINPESGWWKDRIHPEDHDRILSEINRVFESHLLNWEFSYRYLNATDEYKYINDRAYIVYNKEGEPERMIGAMQDVTELTEYRLELENKVIVRTRELNEALQNEKELVELKSRFVSMASHEFRTPLSSIALAAGFIRKYKKKLKPEDIDRKLESIETQVSHMSFLLNDVLTVGKGEAGKIEVTLARLNLKKLFEDLAMEVIATTRRSHRINLYLECDGDNRQSDEGLLRNIIINLLTNAIKYSPNSNEIDFTVVCRDQLATIRVRDHGIGILQEDVERLFEPFFRSKNATTISGTGLGLSIVKRAVDLLKGEISVKSYGGEGTEFVVTLPMIT